jgi:Zn-dependent protease with chaperone function/tellurite resistance protein
MAGVDLAGVQSRRDRVLRADLAANRDVRLALARVEKETMGWGFTGRRRLLSDALRLSRSMAPSVFDALDACRATLGYEGPIELFVKPDPMMNAGAARFSGGVPAIILSSRLIEVFTEPELRFVIGHELGHIVFKHFDLPMPLTATIEDMAGVIVPRATALKLFLWSRAAEVTADRAGLVCGQDAQAAASGFFKLASGLSSEFVRPDLEVYARQVELLASAPAARVKPREDDDTLDCFNTHPYSPLRVRAVVAYSKSKAFKAASGKGEGTLADDDMEAIIERDFEQMEPSYLEHATEHSEVLRKALYLGGHAVAMAHGDISAPEREALTALLGAELVQRPPPFSDLDVVLAAVKATAPLGDRARLLQHIALVAAADGVVVDEELQALGRIAQALDVPPIIIDETLHAASAPLD